MSKILIFFCKSIDKVGNIVYNRKCQRVCKSKHKKEGDLNLEHDARIKVVDSPCGWGKSSYAIQYINSLPNDVKVIYITPFLSETDRIRAECPSRNFKQPDSSRAGTKSADFIRLIEKEENISSTHALFKGISRDLINLLKAKNYLYVSVTLCYYETCHIMFTGDFSDDR